MRRAIQSSLLT